MFDTFRYTIITATYPVLYTERMLLNSSYVMEMIP